MARPIIYPSEQVARVIFDKGGSITQTAIELGCDRQTVYNVLKRSQTVRNAKQRGLLQVVEKERQAERERVKRVNQLERNRIAYLRRMEREAIPPEERKPIEGNILPWRL